MKKFLKKANRGLLLSAIILVVLVIYIVSDYFSFQSQKDTINQTVNNYFTDIYNANLTKTGTLTEHCDEIKKIIRSYWSDAETFDSWTTRQSDMIDYAEYLITDKEAVLDISDVNFSISQMKVKKIGPGYASVTLSYSVSITGKSNSYAITPSYCRILSENEDSWDEDEDMDDLKDSTENNGTSKKEPVLGTLKYSVPEAVIELHKEDGTWKICSFDAYSNSSSFVPAE